jgi:hypothetical protein
VLIGTAEAAFILKVTERQVRRLRNDLDGRKISGVWMFPLEVVEQYAEERESGRAGPGSGAATR